MSDRPRTPLVSPPWSEFRAALEAEGFRPTKTRGQNFLTDGNMARAIALDSGVGAGDLVLEVGPGCGVLSLQLAGLGVKLVGVEIEARLLRVAAGFLKDHPDVTLLHADVLAGKHRLAPEVAELLPREGPWHLVSNLPYGVAGPLLVVLARLANPPRSMTALVQGEVAARIAARAGDAAWGALGARLAVAYRTRRGRSVGAQLFWPRPRVESALVHLELREDRPRDLEAYDALVHGLFQRRRKTLRSALRDLLGDAGRAQALLEESGLDPRARPQTLDSEALLALSGSALFRSSGGG